MIEEKINDVKNDYVKNVDFKDEAPDKEFWNKNMGSDDHETNDDSDLIPFLQGCMTENLNHARHVETEIHTFTGIYMAVVAGVLGFGFSINIDNMPTNAEDIGTGFWINLLPLIMYLIIMAGGNLALRLIKRWYEAFDRHMIYAERAYYMQEALLLSGKGRTHVIDIWNCSLEELRALEELDPLFAFTHPRKQGEARTREMITLFFKVIIWLLAAASIITVIVIAVCVMNSGILPRV